MNIGTKVKLNRGLYKGNTGTITDIIDYHGQDLYFVTMVRIDNTTGKLYKCISTVNAGDLELAK